MSVTFHKKEVDFLPSNKREIRNWIDGLIKSYGKAPADINFIYTNDEELLSINRQYLDHDYYTDIITFDYVEGELVSGDIFISIERVRENATTYSGSFNDELKRVMAHGILHLLGLHDSTSEEQQKMRHKEDEALQRVKDLLIV